MSRTNSAIKNIKFAIIGQIGGIIISFIARIFFLKYLSAEYLGVNSLFTNILTVLSFAELGFGTAITYSLYKPLAQKKSEEVKTLMDLFKKIYICVGLFILVVGIAMTPFLSFFIKEQLNVGNLSLIFILFVINSSLSYFFSYKRTLIIADQNRYIATIIRYIFYILMNVVQILILLLFKNYIFYLIIQILFTFAENVFISLKADKMYPFLKEKNVKPLKKTTKKEILKNTRAMMMHKIGGIVVNAIDNIIISKYVGVIVVGLYSNYLLIKTGLETVLGQIFSSLSAGVGNLCVSSSKTKQYEIFKIIDFMTFVLFSITTTSFFIVSRPFITLWIGKDYVFPTITILLIAMNFYLTGMRKSVLTFREALGLFYKDRYKPFLEALINLVVSIVLASKFGINGVLMGTIASSILLTIEWEVYILYHYGFEMKVYSYYKNYFVYLFLTIFFVIISYFISCYISDMNILVYLLLSVLVGIALPCMIIFIVYNKSYEFIYLKNIIIKKIKKRGE